MGYRPAKLFQFPTETGKPSLEDLKRKGNGNFERWLKLIEQSQALRVEAEKKQAELLEAFHRAAESRENAMSSIEKPVLILMKCDPGR